MAFAVAMKVSGWVITSSSRSTPTSINAKWSALVPFTQTTAFLAPVYSATSSSKRSTNLPTLETNVESIHSLRYFFSFPMNRGSCKGINASGVRYVSRINFTISANLSCIVKRCKYGLCTFSGFRDLQTSCRFLLILSRYRIPVEIALILLTTNYHPINEILLNLWAVFFAHRL